MELPQKVRKNKGVKNGRHRILRASNYKCWYCGIKFTKTKLNERTIDHVTPLSRGGATEDSNLVGSCKDCNCEKDSMTLEEYRQFLRKKRNKKKLPKFFGERKPKPP